MFILNRSTHNSSLTRAKKIDDAMKAMPDKIKKYEQEIKDRKPKKDIFYLIKKAGELGKKGK